ncbi:steroid 17-alpha-hydroxylase/17,20 lyase-like isoform X3 [Pomacea canaliculata]|nr:steroid 17-alpha-hydroxylase/17,20 lyase-like isoform X3 [Pomacea canaliculata]
MTWLLGLAVLLLYLLHKIFASRKKGVPPGPTGVKLFFDVVKAMKGGTLHLLGEKLARQYGDIVMCRTIIGNLCFLNSARLVRQVFTDKGTELVTNDRPPTFSGAEVAYNYKDVAFGDGVKSSNWLKTRKLFHSTLKFYGSGVEKLERTMHSELSRLSEDLEELIKMSGEDGCQPLGESCDLKIENFLSSSIRRVIAILITGEAQGPDSKVPELIGDYALCIQKVASPTTDSLVYNFPFLRFLPGTYYKQLCDKTLKCRNALMEQVFTKGKANHVPGQPKGMLGVLFEEQMNNSRDWLTDDHIRALILDIVGGGYVTSTELLKSFFLYLTHNPQVMKRIQEEVDSVMGPRLPSFDDRKAMPFTEAAILEGLRVVSVLPLGLPHLTREDVSTGGFYLPKGTMLLENVWWMNRDPTAWEDPEVFRPDRFLDDEGQLLPATHPTRMRFLPFGVGRRSCSGENFARSRAFLYVTTLLQQFDFLPPVNHDLLPLTQDSWTDGIVLQLKPYHVAIKKRSLS